MAFRGLLLLLALTLVGCAGLGGKDGVENQAIDPPASVEHALSSAEELAADGYWSRALTTLDAASVRFPGNAELDEARRNFIMRREYQELALEDQILVDEAENQQRKIRLLEQLSRTAPGNLLITSRRIYWKEVFAGKVDRLIECSEAHAGSKPVLARRCYTVASELGASDETEQRLNAVAVQLRERENLAAQQRKARADKERQQRAKALLVEAKASIDAHDYRRALDSLARVAKLQPENAEVAGLQQEAWAMISPQVEALIKLGDHLYLDEQLEAAVATWKAALNLKPKDEDILARIERARTVLDRLDVLRRQQRQPPGAASNTEAGS